MLSLRTFSIELHTAIAMQITQDNLQAYEEIVEPYVEVGIDKVKKSFDWRAEDGARDTTYDDALAMLLDWCMDWDPIDFLLMQNSLWSIDLLFPDAARVLETDVWADAFADWVGFFFFSEQLYDEIYSEIEYDECQKSTNY